MVKKIRVVRGAPCAVAALLISVLSFSTSAKVIEADSFTIDRSDYPTSFILGRFPVANREFESKEKRIQRSLDARTLSDVEGGIEQLEMVNFRAITDSWGDTTRASDSLNERGIELVPLRSVERTLHVLAYAAQLAEEKSKLMKIYHLRNDEYNRLAALAFGILGTESKFFTNLRYTIKQGCPSCAPTLKVIRHRSENDWQPIDPGLSKPFGNGFLGDFVQSYVEDFRQESGQKSHGPTQIKEIPADIEREYAISVESLDHPLLGAGYSALATFGFMAEGLLWAKKLQRRLGDRVPNLQGDGVYDYIPFYYQGGKRMQQAEQGTVEPSRLPYIIELKSYMRDVLIYERARR
jgi:hypothetical protein